MLVLSRRLEEEIVIAGRIRMKVLEIKGNRVRLGITAPPEVPVHRSEACPDSSNPPVEPEVTDIQTAEM